MFRYLVIVLMLLLFTVNSCLNSNTKNDTIQKIVFVDSIKREDAVKYMGEGEEEVKLDVQDNYGDAVRINTYNIRTKETQSTILELSPDEEYKFSYVDKDEIKIYTVFENETNDKTILLKKLNKNSLEMLSSEIVLTSIPKNKLNAEDFSDTEVLQPTVKSDSVFLRNSLKINEVVAMTINCSSDVSKLMINTVYTDEVENMHVSTRIYFVKTREVKYSDFALGVKKSQFKAEHLSIQILNNGHVFYVLRNKVDEKTVGWTYFLLGGTKVKSLKIKKNDISDLIVEDDEELGEFWVADSSKSGVLTQYILFQNGDKRILGKATVNINKESISGVRIFKFGTEVKSNLFKVIRCGNDEIICFDYLEKKQKDVENYKLSKPSKPSNYKYDIFTKTESYVVKLDSSFKEKWSIKKSVTYTESTYPCIYRWEKIGGSLIVNLFEPNRQTCDIVDVHTGKVIDSRILQELEGEKSNKVAKIYKIYSTVFGKYIHSYNRYEDIVMVYELK